MRRPNSLVARFYAFKLTNASGFYLPIYFAFLQDKGFDLAFLGVLSATFSFALVAAEIPTGYLGDRLGRRGSLAVGATVRAGIMMAFPFVPNRAGYVVLFGVWATGWAFRSGTQDAWLYEVLQSTCDEDEYARVDGRANAIVLGTSAVAAVLGGVLYTVEPAAPFLANAALALVGLPILYSFPAVETAGDDERFGLRDAVALLRAQAHRPAVRWFVAYAAVFATAFAATRPFEQPMLRAVGVPVAGLGVLYAGFKLVSAGAASLSGTVEDRFGVRGAFAALPAVYGVAFAAIAVVPVAAVPVVFLNRAIRTMTRPLQNQYLNDRLDDVGRATVLSGASMALSLVSGAGKLVAGRVTDVAGALDGVAAFGVALAVLGAVIWLAVDPVRASPGADAADSGVDATATSD
ncbi:MFS transporter [Halorubellus sp. PRR65]|uniref:MFS transporter n=1 Tax=Halorubellus sp. PRR65 TaxID=3098148 RepID=UPI002B25E701|nr:MFS transporter [Halorubellus sp. PRR65]